MSSWDLVIFETPEKKEVVNRLRLTEKTMETAGQHGKAIILADEQGKEWLLKTFSNIIDFDLEKISDLEVDIEDSAEESRHRMHLWRVMNELTASRLGQRLRLNVPKVIVVCSQKIADLALKESSPLTLGDVVILDDEDGGPETADEFYDFTNRETYSIETSANFEQILAGKSTRNDPSTILALISEKIPDTINLDEYLDSYKDLDGAFESIRKIDDGYFLLPFDIWLNDPDRNAGNYLVQFNESNEVIRIWGIDYEMWALGSDIWMEEDEITKGRSYLTAIIHPTTNIFDPRVHQTIHRIRSLDDGEITSMTLSSQLLCKFFEYHITQKNLDPEERIVLKQVETNLEDFLSESRPRSDKLSDILIKQIGLPSKFKP
ncbi:MAG: hypothetical protein ACW97X_08210 [Candidatus Hodarchaeales archaeon]|jgi:hypothetical protein